MRGVPGADNSATEIVVYEVAYASTAAQTTATQASDHLKTVSEDLNLHLPACYAV